MKLATEGVSFNFNIDKNILNVTHIYISDIKLLTLMQKNIWGLYPKPFYDRN